MRNAILAAALVAAGLSANLGTPNSTAGDKHLEAKSDPLQRGRATQSDHPLAVLYEQEPRPPGPAEEDRDSSGLLKLHIGGTDHQNLELMWKVPSPQPDRACPVLLPFLTQVSFMIATVPDPTRTHLALNLDRQLEAIMAAAEDTGYSFDRYWLPWRLSTTPETPDPHLRGENEHAEEERHRQPGLLLFRRTSRESHRLEFLAVFLVGETPTNGIDLKQFRNASCYIHQLQGGPTVLPILAPTFSGSFSSLDTAITDSFSPESVNIVSGSASSFCDIEGFAKRYSNFHTTLHDDYLIFLSLNSYFQNSNRVAFLKGLDAPFQDSSQPALLVEGGTAYGECNAEKLNKKAKVFSYPRDISRVRGAYQDYAMPPNGADAAAVRRQLQFALRDAKIGRDMVPEFSPEQTPVTQETALLQLAQTLNRERFTTVIVTATNVLDGIFLSRFLHEYCPDLRSIVFDSDLLFVHGNDSIDYWGTFGVSTYMMGRPAENRMFSSNVQEALYNATKFLLDRNSAKPSDYSTPFFGYNDRPPIWLSVVGHNTYWPVDVLANALPTAENDLHFQRYPATSGRQVKDYGSRPSRLWNTAFSAGCLLTLLYIATCGFALYSCSPLKRWCADFHPSPDSSAAAKDAPASPRVRWHVLTTFLLLIAVLLASYAPMCLSWGSHIALWDWGAGFGLSIGGCLFLLLVYTAWKYWRHGLFLAVVALLTSCWLGFNAIQLDAARLFRAIRSVELPSGVAPNLPLILLLLALAWWSWLNMQRAIFNDERNPRFPNLMELPQSVPRDVLPFLDALLFTGGKSGSGIVILTILFTFVPLPWFGSMESRVYDLVFTVALAITGGLLLVTAYAYGRVWRRLRRYLESLNLHPVREAFSALPPVAAWSPLWQSTARKRSYALPQRCLETLRMLCSTKGNYYPELVVQVQDFEDKLKAVREHADLGQRESAAEASAVNMQGILIAEQLDAVLMQNSWKTGSSESYDAVRSGARKDAAKSEVPCPEMKADLPDFLAAEFIAMRCTAFIRYVLLHLQNQLSFLTGGFILVTIALNCYPFRGSDYFRWWVTTVFVLMSAVVVAVFVEMERDATLSRLSNTKAGHIDGGLLLKLATAGALPLLTVVASHFPGVGRFLFSWIQPALSAMH